MAGLTESLTASHRLHLELAQVNEELARGPRQLKIREQKIITTQNEAVALREELKQIRAAADRKSLDLKTREAKLADLRAKLNACASNREYEVLRGQIEADEVANSVLEDEILELLEKVDLTQRGIGETEAREKQLQAECSEFAAKVAAAAMGLEAQVQSLTEQVRAAEPALTGENLLRYRRLVEAYGADGLASVDAKGICSYCYVAQTPQNQVHIKTGAVIFCSNCGRIQALRSCGQNRLLLFFA